MIFKIKTLAVVIFCCFIFFPKGFGQQNKKDRYSKMSHDQLFLIVGVEDTDGWENALLLAEIIPQEYLLAKLVSKESEDIIKALIILGALGDVNTIDEVSKLLDNKSEWHVRGGAYAITRIDPVRSIPILLEKLIDNEYKDKETFISFLYHIRDYPQKESLDVLNVFIENRSLKKTTEDQELLKLAEKIRTLLVSYFESTEKRREVVEEAVNNSLLNSWGLKVMEIEKSDSLYYSEVLKRSKYSSSFQYLKLRYKLTGNENLTEKEQEIIKTYLDNPRPKPSH